jgi:predicted histidine transporter YuiF (NhaC family)
LDGIIGFLGSMERELTYIYWDTKNFRRIEEQETLSVHSDVKKGRKKDDIRLKTSVIQIILAFILLAVFLSDKLDIANFAGLVIITAAVDLLILKKQKILDSKNI